LSNPKGSHSPRGGWAPISEEKLIFTAEEGATRDTGAKAAAEPRVKRTAVLKVVEREGGREGKGEEHVRID
jgi:hypothetical protein